MNTKQTTISPNHAPASWRIEVFYDGDCPLCLREINMLRRMDRKGRIRFTDIAAADFRTDDLGASWGELMSEIHGRLPDGTWVRGVEVFRQLYSAVGWGAIVSLSRLPLIRGMLDLGYRVFARNRLRWTGRCTPDGESCHLDDDRSSQHMLAQPADATTS